MIPVVRLSLAHECRAFVFVAVACLLAMGATADVALTETLALRGGARSYWSSAYLSSTGSWKYDAPVLEQYLDLTLDAGEYGCLRTDAWIFSDVSGTCQDVHRRAFSCYEGTLTYGYEIPFDAARTIRLKTHGGVLWDWLGGYKVEHGTPIYYQLIQSFENPFLTPYWNGLYGPFTGGDTWIRLRIGVQREFRPVERLTVAPFTDVTWGDSARYEKNYGEHPNHHFLGGSLMFAKVGTILKWALNDSLYLWGRYQHFFTLDAQARRLLKGRRNDPDTCDYPIFSVGLGARF